MTRPRISIFRAPGLERASAWASLPMRARRPRFEAATSMLPFTMNPMPPNIFTSCTAGLSATATRTLAAISSGPMIVLLAGQQRRQLIDGPEPAFGVTLRRSRAIELHVMNLEIRAGFGTRDGDTYFRPNAGMLVRR